MHSCQAIALGFGIVIFLITVFLSSRRMIRIPLTLILLIIAAGMSWIIGHQHPVGIQATFQEMPVVPPQEEEAVQKEILQALNHTNSALTQEKELLQKIADGIQTLIQQNQETRSKESDLSPRNNP